MYWLKCMHACTHTLTQTSLYFQFNFSSFLASFLPTIDNIMPATNSFRIQNSPKKKTLKKKDLFKLFSCLLSVLYLCSFMSFFSSFICCTYKVLYIYLFIIINYISCHFLFFTVFVYLSVSLLFIFIMFACPSLSLSSLFNTHINHLWISVNECVWFNPNIWQTVEPRCIFCYLKKEFWSHFVIIMFNMHWIYFYIEMESLSKTHIDFF